MSPGLVLVLCLSLASAGTVLSGPDGEGYVAGQAIVKLTEACGRIEPRLERGTVQVGVSALDELNRRHRVWDFCRIVRYPNPDPIAMRLGLDRQYILSFDLGVDVFRVIRDFGACPLVEYACPNGVLDSYGSPDRPNDPRYSDQWHLPRIRAPRAWDLAHGDSTVVTAVIDDGLLWTHVEVEPNLWVNGPEDINGNRRFDPLPPPEGDLDGIDQDGNGYGDDVIGWDFIDGDANPTPEPGDEHGTHGWGVQNAVTDNDTGIAAPPWNVRSVALRCGRGGGISVYAAIAAIYYAIPEGVWVLSMGWGSTTPYQPLAEACQYIWNVGALSVASAGSGGQDPVYPAAYEGVIAVAASDENDMKAPFSNYGTWVDVCAPGVNVLSFTSQGYEFWSGTSSATQVVCGILAWMKSAYPDVSNDSAQALLYRWCDSMPDPLYPQGLLGHGRVAMSDSAGVAVGDQEQDAGYRRQNPGYCGVGAEEFFDATGRETNLSSAAPGVYFLRRESGSISRVVVVR